jgi:hypothetical protein
MVKQTGAHLGWGPPKLPAPHGVAGQRGGNRHAGRVRGKSGKSGRFRGRLGFVEPIARGEALRRTIDWERAHPPREVWRGCLTTRPRMPRLRRPEDNSLEGARPTHLWPLLGRLRSAGQLSQDLACPVELTVKRIGRDFGRIIRLESHLLHHGAAFVGIGVQKTIASCQIVVGAAPTDLVMLACPEHLTPVSINCTRGIPIEP